MGASFLIEQRRNLIPFSRVSKINRRLLARTLRQRRQIAALQRQVRELKDLAIGR